MCETHSDIDCETHEFLIPKRAVLSIEDMQMWEKSEAYADYIGFIMAMNDTVKGKPLQVECYESDATKGLMSVLDAFDRMIDEIPPVDQPQRFGNQAFRTWYLRMKEEAPGLLEAALPNKYFRSIHEIVVYLIEGFGNYTRIDYGTGHEMSFLMLICCLYKLGVFQKEDNIAVVTRIFNRYLILVRKLQLTYRMEPAGSHGVWSLDDYQFVPFIWGSSQLIAHPKIEPKSFLLNDVVKEYANQYIFIGCIEFINKVKTGLFAEHSNQLWNISGVPSWTKINTGLIKMYKAEVLSKFPVIQHVLFGSLIKLVPALRRPPLGMANIKATLIPPFPSTST